MFKTQRQPGPHLPILDKGGREARTTEVGTEQEGEQVTASHQHDNVNTTTLSRASPHESTGASHLVSYPQKSTN